MAASAIARTSQMAWRMRRPPLSACWKGAILARRWCELRRQPDIVRFVTAAAIARYDSQVIVRLHGAATGPLRRLCHGLSAFEGHLRERPPGVDRLRGRSQVYGKETDGAAPRFAQDFTSDASPFPNDQSSRPVPTRLKKTSSRRTPRRSWRSSTTRL